MLVRTVDVDGDGVVDNEMKQQDPFERANNGPACSAHSLEETPYNAMSFSKANTCHAKHKTQSKTMSG